MRGPGYWKALRRVKFAKDVVSGTRGLEAATAIRCQWLVIFADAAHMGADRLLDPASGNLKGILDEESSGRGADVVLVAAPVQSSQETALELAAIRGWINYFGGLPKDHPAIIFKSNLVHYKELVVIGTTACSPADGWQTTQVITSGRVWQVCLVKSEKN